MYKLNYSFLFVCFLFILSAACKADKKECENLMYGIPNSLTGISNSKCKPICECKDFTSKSFSAAELASLKAWQLSDTIPEILNNPYNNPIPVSSASVCGVVVDDLANKIYHLETYASPEAALAAGAILTHYDACGVCSTLEDFTVYAENIDIGADVRMCILTNLANPFDSLVSCIEGLGFTKPCAQIWAYNAKNTQTECFNVCIQDTTYNNSDGTLSDCLQCDETKSGPVFKAFAGRTRRNTGVASSICRFCDEVQYVEHNYPF